MRDSLLMDMDIPFIRRLFLQNHLPELQQLGIGIVSLQSNRFLKTVVEYKFIF